MNVSFLILWIFKLPYYVGCGQLQNPVILTPLTTSPFYVELKSLDPARIKKKIDFFINNHLGFTKVLFTMRILCNSSNSHTYQEERN